MPMFDVTCEPCQYDKIEVWAWSRAKAVCPNCGGPVSTFYGYSKASEAHGDEIDYVAENLGPTPVHIRSKSERRRLMKENGLEEMVRHTGIPGTDKSPHTSRWDAASPEQLAGAIAMLERVGRSGGKSAEQIEADIQHGVDIGQIDVPISTPDGTIRLTVGDMYSGVIDMSIFKK